MSNGDPSSSQPAWKRFAQRQQDRAAEFGGKANYIIDVIETPCEDKWNVLVKTALPALGDSMIMLITPQPSEILEEYLEPKGRRGASRRAPRRGPRTRNTRSGTRRPWARPRLPYFDGWAAQKLPGRDFFRARDVGGAEKFFWKGLNMADRLFWWWLIIDATENFVVNWHSGLMHSRFCSRAWDLIGELTFERSNVNTGFPTSLWGDGTLSIEKEKGLDFGTIGKTNLLPNDTPNNSQWIIEASGYADSNNDFSPDPVEMFFVIETTDFDHITTEQEIGHTTVGGTGDPPWEMKAEITLSNVNEVRIRMDERPAPGSEFEVSPQHETSELTVIGEFT